ncbi:hypothetical protein [Azospirillum largimobile]
MILVRVVCERAEIWTADAVAVPVAAADPPVRRADLAT